MAGKLSSPLFRVSGIREDLAFTETPPPASPSPSETVCRKKIQINVCRTRPASLRPNNLSAKGDPTNILNVPFRGARKKTKIAGTWSDANDTAAAQ
jgi:hypothetical protein